MSKELEALKCLKENKRRHWLDNDNSQECLDTIETALKELTEYKKVFEKLNLDINDAIDLENWIKLAQFHYENKSKKLKALEIIKKKQVDVGALYEFEFDLEWYNKYVKEINGTPTLTQKECDLLKGILL